MYSFPTRNAIFFNYKSCTNYNHILVIVTYLGLVTYLAVEITIFSAVSY
jgi:hypothetical protein